MILPEHLYVLQGNFNLSFLFEIILYYLRVREQVSTLESTTFDATKPACTLLCVDGWKVDLKIGTTCIREEK